jgi:hypothetical protein
MTDNDKEKKTREIMVTGVPPLLKSDFKILCFQNQVSMSETIVSLLKIYVEKEKAND